MILTNLVKSNYKVVIGFGSNLNKPKNQVLKAVKSVESLSETQLVKVSSCYRSKPQGPQDQPDFVNAVAIFYTAKSPEVFLKSLQKIEKNQGKSKRRHWGERMIDLDILLFDNLSINTETLTVPHPEISNRDFVLIPLAEISPNLQIAGLGKIEDLIAELSETYLIRT